QAGVANQLAQVGQRSTILDVLVKLADPGLDPLVSRLGNDLDFLHERQLLTRDGAGVQAEGEWLDHRLRLGAARWAGQCASPDRHGRSRQPFASRKLRRHGTILPRLQNDPARKGDPNPTRATKPRGVGQVTVGLRSPAQWAVANRLYCDQAMCVSFSPSPRLMTSVVDMSARWTAMIRSATGRPFESSWVT